MNSNNDRSRYRRNFAPQGTHELILSEIPSGSLVLDVGCATGYLGETLRKHDCLVYGVDADQSALSDAARHYVDVAMIDLDTATKLPWADVAFDVIVAADVLEHLREPERAIAFLMRYGRPGARIILSMPNVAHFSVRFPLLLGRFRYTDSGILDRTHCHLFTFATALDLARRSGLSVERALGGSNRFGTILRSPVGSVLRGLLSYNIVIIATVADNQ